MSEVVVPKPIERLKTLGAVAAALGLAACAAGWASDATQLLRSWLFAFLFWSGIAIGSLTLLMINYQSGGRWGAILRRLCEAATRTFPLLALLFVPIALGVPRIYGWAGELAHDEIVQAKAAYLNVPFFLGRAAFYFLFWIVVAGLLNRWSLQSDAGHDERRARKQRMLSGGGLVAQALVITFMSFDWGMSLDAHWFSTVYGVWFIIGTLLTAMTFNVAVLTRLLDEKPFAGLVERHHLHDLGKLTFAFLMFWAYIGFSQFLIVWSANLPEEIPWYLRRFQGGFGYLILAVVLLHFALPYALLLSQDVKSKARLLKPVVTWLCAMRALELYWLVSPDAGTAHGTVRALHLHWLDLAAFAGLGGLWLLVFAHQLSKHPLLPLGEPDLPQASAAAAPAALAGGHA